MSDPEVATKVPESDAVEQIPPAVEPSTHSDGPGLSDHCVTDRPARKFNPRRSLSDC